MEASWLHPNSIYGALPLNPRIYTALDANLFSEIPREYTFEWPIVEAVGETLAVLNDAAQFAGRFMLVCTYDMSKWFRQLAAAPS